MKRKIALSALSHLIGAYWSLAQIASGQEEPKRDSNLRQILLHGIGIYWIIMKVKFGIENPKKKIEKPLESKP